MTLKKFAAKKLGSNFRFYRFAYVLISLVSWFLLMYLWLPKIPGIIYKVSDIPNYTLRALQVFGFFMLAKSLQAFDGLAFIGIRQIFPSQIKKTSQIEPLNTKGVFALVRHPIYLFTLVILWANPVMTKSWFLLSIMVAIYCYVGSILEERKLVETYGQQYLEYRKKVPRILPLINF